MEILGTIRGNIIKMHACQGAGICSHNALHTMDNDEDTLDILQQILKLKILDSDTQGSRVLGSTGASYDRATEVISNDISNGRQRFAAEETRKILDNRNIEVQQQKPKRGRPRKRVRQHRQYLCLTTIQMKI